MTYEERVELAALRLRSGETPTEACRLAGLIGENVVLLPDRRQRLIFIQSEINRGDG